MPENNNFYLALERASGRVFKILSGSFDDLSSLIHNEPHFTRMKERKNIHDRLGDKWSVKEGDPITLFANKMVR